MYILCGTNWFSKCHTHKFIGQGLKERTFVNEITVLLCLCVCVCVCVCVCLAISAFGPSTDFLGTFAARYAT